jgi:Mg-chelatase subunit ChlD
VWNTLHAHIDRLSRDLIEVFEKRNRSRITRGHPAGIRITLRAAMQFEAQPILYRRLWEKKSRPQRIDPVMILVIDRSGSMQGDNIARTFEGIVLLSEVAARVGLPLELFTFSNTPRHELEWDEGVGEDIRKRLGELPDRCDGGTELHGALKAVRARVAALPFRDVFLVVLSDGATNDAAAAKDELRRLRRAGVRCVGLGLGDGAGAMADLFPGDPVGVPVDQVPERFMTILRGFVGL